MSVSKMTKIQLTVVKDAYNAVINVLHNLGAIEIEQIKAPENKLYKPESKAEYWKTSVKFALDLLSDYEKEEKQSFLEKLAPQKQEVSESAVKELESNFEYKSIVGELENLDKQFNTFKNTISQHKKDQKSLKEWTGLPIITELQGRFSHFSIGTIPTTRFEDFTQKVEQIKLLDVNKINESEREVRVIITAANEAEDEVKVLLEEFEFKAASLDLTDKSIEEQINEHEESIQENQKELETVEGKIKKYAVHIPKFKILYDYLSWRSEQDEAAKKALTTKATVSFLGWLPHHMLSDVRELIEKETGDYILEEIQIDEDEKIPVALRNSSIVTPFESVTEVYGVPMHSEPDPTLLLAPFFFVYFAFCLSDVAYGVMLAGLSFLALKLMKPKGMSRKLMILMIFCGGATVIAGALFGGWFGIDVATIPGPIGDAMRTMQVLNPVQDPMTVLLVAFILGYVQLIVGNIVDLVWKIRHDQAKAGILGSGMWALFLVVIGFWISIKAGVLPENLSSVGNWTMIVMIIVMVLTQGHDQKNVFAKLGFGAASLYGLVGYLSDVLSYSRLLALGLSTGIIAMVVNMVANLFGSMIPYVGWLVFILILVGGHLFNLTVSALGAFIHSGRLQYVEYFPKFLEGGGRKFKPLIKTSKYINLKSN